MRRTMAYLRLIRPVNCVMMGFAVIIGAVLAGFSDLNSSWLNLVLGFVTGFMLTAASMAMNDYYDREIDAVNEPKRPIPSGIIKPTEALVLAFLFTVVGFSAAYLTGMLCLLTSVIAWFIVVAYTTVGKRSGLPGNFLVSICVAIPFVYGSIAATGTVMLKVMLFAVIAFLSITGREVTKGIVDLQGDKLQNVKTLAVRYGERSAAAAAVFFYLFAVVLSPIPWLAKLVSFWYIPLVAVTDFGLVACSFMLLKDSSRENARKVKNSALFFFIFGLLAFVAGAYG
jgi:geranylgeranylglycerol-phosphate geranylgeranyltransferase